jgi:integrase
MATKAKTKEPGIYKRLDDTGRVFSFIVQTTVNGTDQVQSFAVRRYGKGSKAESLAYKDACAWKRQKQELGSKGRLGDAARGEAMTLSELRGLVYADPAHVYAKKTLRNHASCWTYIEKCQLDTKRIAKIDTNMVEACLRIVEAPMMRDKVRGLLSMLLSYAVDHQWLYQNVVPKRAVPKTRASKLAAKGELEGKKKRYLNPDELQRLVSELPERYKTLTLLMAFEGLRPGEAYALKVGKLQWTGERYYLHVDTSTSGFTKTGEPRTIPLFPSVGRLMEEHIDRYSDRHDPDALIFTAEQGGPILEQNFRERVFTPATKRAGINGGSYGPNALRHTAASFLAGAGYTLHAISKLLGHSRPSITADVYVDLFDDSLEAMAVSGEHLVAERLGLSEVKALGPGAS